MIDSPRGDCQTRAWASRVLALGLLGFTLAAGVAASLPGSALQLLLSVLGGGVLVALLGVLIYLAGAQWRPTRSRDVDHGIVRLATLVVPCALLVGMMGTWMMGWAVAVTVLVLLSGLLSRSAAADTVLGAVVEAGLAVTLLAPLLADFPGMPGKTIYGAFVAQSVAWGWVVVGRLRGVVSPARTPLESGPVWPRVVLVLRRGMVATSLGLSLSVAFMAVPAPQGHSLLWWLVVGWGSIGLAIFVGVILWRHHDAEHRASSPLEVDRRLARFGLAAVVLGMLGTEAYAFAWDWMAYGSVSVFSVSLISTRSRWSSRLVAATGDLVVGVACGLAVVWLDHGTSTSTWSLTAHSMAWLGLAISGWIGTRTSQGPRNR